MANITKELLFSDGVTVSPPANISSSAGSFAQYANDADYVTGKGSVASDGDAYYNTTDDTIHYYSDGAWSLFIDNDSTQNVAGKTITDDQVFSSTGAIKLPVGTELQRPSPSAGQIRYNSDTGGFEGYTDKWGSIGGGATPIAIDHTTTTLELNSFYAIDMSGASGNVTFTFPDMVDGDQFKALVFGNDTNGYLATFQTTSPQNIYYRGETDTTIQLVVPDAFIGGLWDTNNSYVAAYDASTFLSGTLAGDWDIEGSLTVDTINENTSTSGVSIQGRSDGSESPSNSVGQIIRSTATITTTTLGTSFTDVTNSTLTLTAGCWRIEYSSTIQVTSGTNAGNESIGSMWVDLGGTRVASTIRTAGVKTAAAAASSIRTTISASEVVSFSGASRNYGLVCFRQDISGVGSASIINTTDGATSFFAIRIA